MVERRDPGVCPGHEELRDIALGTRNDVKHLTDTLNRFMASMESHEERIRDLEIHGANISQENAEGLKELAERVKTVEGFIEGHKAATVESAKISAGVATAISIAIGLIGIWITVFGGRL